MSAWINQIFRAGQVNKGNIVRRSRDDVWKYASLQMLIYEVSRRGFTMLRIGDQYIIICNQDRDELDVMEPPGRYVFEDG
jgi:hypothetical protein